MNSGPNFSFKKLRSSCLPTPCYRSKENKVIPKHSAINCSLVSKNCVINNNNNISTNCPKDLPKSKTASTLLNSKRSADSSCQKEPQNDSSQEAVRNAGFLSKNNFSGTNLLNSALASQSKNNLISDKNSAKLTIANDSGATSKNSSNSLVFLKVPALKPRVSGMRATDMTKEVGF